MHKGKTIIILFAAGLLLFCGCQKNDDIKPSDTVPEKAVYASIDSSAAPVAITEEDTSFSGITVMLPKVSGITNYDGINAQISNGISAFISDSAGEIKSIEYSIKYNAHGILSILFTAETKDGTKKYRTFNYSTAGGSEINLNSLYSEQSSWRSVAKFYIETLLRLNKTETFADAEIDDSIQFCLSEEKLLFIYDTYEITYYSNGALLFEVPYSLLSEYCIQGGAIDIITGKG